MVGVILLLLSFCAPRKRKTEMAPVTSSLNQKKEAELLYRKGCYNSLLKAA